MGNPTVLMPIGIRLAEGLFAIALALSAASAFAGNACDVPAQYASLTAAIADDTCAVINLAEGRYAPQTITRAVVLVGAGPALSLIAGTLETPAIVADGDAALLTLENIRLEAGNGPEAVLLTINGGQIASVSNIEVGRISPLFSDGFEGTTP